MFAWALVVASAWGSPTQFFSVEDYRRLIIGPTGPVRSLDVYVGVADRWSSAFGRAIYRVHRANGEAVNVDTGLRKLKFSDASSENLPVRMREAEIARRAAFANVAPPTGREPLFTEPAVVLFTGNITSTLHHEVAVAVNEDEFARLEHDLDVEVRLKHHLDVDDPNLVIDADHFGRVRARVHRLGHDEAVMINRLTYLAACDANLVAH